MEQQRLLGIFCASIAFFTISIAINDIYLRKIKFNCYVTKVKDVNMLMLVWLMRKSGGGATYEEVDVWNNLKYGKWIERQAYYQKIKDVVQLKCVLEGLWMIGEGAYTK